MAEQTFLNERGVTVTNSRLIFPAQTYAMSGITSVKSLIRKPKMLWKIILAVVGLMLLMGGSGTWMYGVLFIAAGAAWWYFDKTQYIVSLVTAGGEAEALVDKDEGFIERVIKAVNDAIVHRG